MGKHGKNRRALRVAAAALRLVSDKREIITAPDHVKALDKVRVMKGRARSMFDYEPGFLLSNGKFATRTEAMFVARNAGQLDRLTASHCTRLFTYMLRGWDRPVSRAAPRGAAVTRVPPERARMPETFPPELASLRPEDPEGGFTAVAVNHGGTGDDNDYDAGPE